VPAAEARDRPGRPRRALLLPPAAGLLLALLTVAALGGVVGNGFVDYDDDLYVSANRELARGPGLDGLRWAFTTTRGGNWHPLTWVSHLVDVRLFGLRPAGHHAVNLAIHVVNVWLLFALLHRLAGALWPAALAAALFAVHPLHVESVAWVAERKDVLSTLFALAAALAYLRGVRRPGASAAGASAAAAALFALALLAKPMPVTLPLLLLALDWWPLGRWTPLPGVPAPAAAAFARLLPPARLWREKAPLLALAAASSVVTLIVQERGGAMQVSAGVPLAARAANAAVAYAVYLRKALWPADLAVFYPFPWGGLPPFTVAAAAVVLAAAAVAALRSARRRPWIAVGAAWYVGTLVPVIGLVQVGEQALADRYTYLPLVGPFVAAAWWLAAVAARGRRATVAAAAAALAVLGVLGALSARQVRVWHDSVALFSHAVAVTRDNYVAHNNLGTTLLEHGRAAEAIPHFEEVVRTFGWSPRGHQNLGRALVAVGRPAEAVPHLLRAIEIDPADPLPRRNLGVALAAAGRQGEAIAAWREAVRLDPRDAAALDLLGVALAKEGRAGEAVPLLESAAALDPASQSIRTHLAIARRQAAAVTRPPTTQ
jgi:Flp pilus assembly protein TadD